jgi:hypothetical protein
MGIWPSQGFFAQPPAIAEESRMIAYRSSAPSIVLTILVVPLSLVVAGAVGGFAGQSAGFALYLMFVLATGALVGIVAVPCILVGPNGIEVRNIAYRYKIPWSNVSQIKAYSRIRMTLTSGETIVCWAVQTNNLQLVSGKDGRAQRVARELEVLRTRYAQNAQASESRVQRTALLSTVWWTIGMGASVAVISALIAANGVR